MSSSAQRAGHQREAARIRDADDLTSGMRRIRQRADHVHHRLHAKLATHGSHVPHRRMHERREHEDDPRVA